MDIAATLGRLRPMLGVGLLLLVWWVATALEVADPVLLPPPQKAFRALYDGLIGGPLLADFAQTIYRTVLSFLIASAIAIPLGVALGAADKLYRSVEFVIDFFRSTPASAVFPLFLVLFGVGDKTKIAVAAFGAVLVILFNVAYGVMNARKTRVLAAKVMGANRLQILKDVYFWESLPQTFIGMRNGISLCLVIIVVAEMFIGSTDGIGHRLIEAQMLFEMPTMYAAIFAAGALGYGMNWIFLTIEKTFVHWGGK
ncbi:ABC transporter permease [Ferrovibrio sp.]|jgi:ABC-type nitrate/sulfonate/bicarbonate transport system permease component|uniref:ABC transporter permease n=1 Tax=Ferrovibrio sp. TaxID=1917215 RepID=UPI0035AEF65A